MAGGRVGGGGSASGGGGGRIGGGGFGGGSFGGGRVSGGGFGGGFGGSRPSGSRPGSSRPSSSRPGGSGYRPTHYPTYVRPVYYSGGGGGGSHNSHNGPSGGSSGGTGCLSGTGAYLLIAVLVIIFIVILFSATGGDTGDVTASTVQREPLAAGSVELTGYYEDTTGLIRRSTALQSGMKHFYEKTGVQPFLYVTPDIDGDTEPSDETLEAYCEALYSHLFTDSAHFLLVVYDPGSEGFGFYYIPGNAAKTVMDPEAMEIFEGYLYQDADTYLSGDAEGYFSDAFEHTADRIMQVTRSGSFYVGLGVVVFAILALLFRWWRKVKEQKNKEAEHMQHVLETDIEDLVDNPELKDLEEKYGKEDAPQKPKPKPKPKTDEGFTDVDLKDPALADLEEKYKD